MNAPLRRVGVVVLVLFGLLFANLNWVQAYKAESYTNNEHNGRVQLTEYQRQRGTIFTADGSPVAKSVPTGDSLKYLRQYPFGGEYAQIVGYKSVTGGMSGVERAENAFLSGNADALFVDRLKEMFTDNKSSGGNIILTVLKSAQDTAYQDLLHNQVGAKHAAAVALDPATGAILAMASTPSYDPNPLVSHDTEAASTAFNRLDGNSDQPLLNRTIAGTYPPGSTMKVVVSAAALRTGQYTKDTVIPAGPSYTPIAGGGFTIHNAESSICPDATITLILALTESCNTGFAQLGVKLGSQTLIQAAQDLGFEDGGVTIAGGGDSAIGVAASHTGKMTGDGGQDDPNAVAQSSIGQLNVRETPLFDAMIAATVANNGTQMRPYLVDKQQAPDLTTVYPTQSKALRNPFSPDVAQQLQQMMISVVEHGTGRRARISGFQVGGKTGTAQNADSAQDHGWFIGFAMKDGRPIVATAVFLENAGPGGSAQAAQIAGDIMKSVIAARGLK